jgi:hypothetical protein
MNGIVVVEFRLTFQNFAPIVKGISIVQFEVQGTQVLLGCDRKKIIA